MSAKDELLEYLLIKGVGIWFWYGKDSQFVYWSELSSAEIHKLLKWLGEEEEPTEESEED